MINKRIFGSAIPIMVQKKLEARQLVAVGDKKPNDSIDSIYNDETSQGSATYNYNELIASNFDMQADLSSRTPFARMWTAVALVNERSFEIDKDLEDLENDDTTAESVEKQIKKFDDLNKVESILKKIKYKELDRAVYIVGTNNLSTLDSSMGVTNSQQNTSGTNQAIFPDEHNIENDNNKFLKPQAGITSIESTTEGTMGVIKKTTVNFIVHNFADYDAIYNKYFMRPGAHVFVDFGWDALIDSEGNPIKLYDPKEILSIQPDGEQTENDLRVTEKLYGVARDDDGVEEDGFVTRCNGDVETINGIVTGYDSKILENGSVECSLEITSKNSALLLYPKIATENTEINVQATFEFDLDTLIFYEQAYNLASATERKSLERAADIVANSDNLIKDEKGFDDYLKRISMDSFGSATYEPSTTAVLSGLFVKDDIETSESYISWGLLEDKIFNKYFGHGNSASSVESEKKFEVKSDSSDGMTTFDQAFIEFQKEAHEPPVFVIPDFWDISYSHPFDSKSRDIQKSGLTRKQRIVEMQENKVNGVNVESLEDLDKQLREVYKNVREGFIGKDKAIHYDGNTVITKYDKRMRRVPIREIFIKIDIVKDAFKDENNETFRDIVNAILEKINEEAYGIWDWRLVGEDNTLKVNDMNFAAISVGPKTQRISDFDKIFKFEIMSKNSIVKKFDVSLEMPDGEIGSMYAIQALTGTPGKMTAISHVIESQSALQSLLKKTGKDIKDVGFKYLPDTGAYQALKESSAELNHVQKVKYFKQAQVMAKKPLSSRKASGVQVPALSGQSVELELSVSAGLSNLTAEETDMTDEQKHQTEERMERALKRTFSPICDTEEEYKRYKITGELQLDGEYFKSLPLPIKLELTIYGIATLKPGDIFRVDYLPEVYVESVFFQVLQVSHTVGTDGWYTTLETQFRTSPHRFEDVNLKLTGDIEEGMFEKRDNLQDILKDANYDEETIAQVVANVVPTPAIHNKDISPVLNPAALKGGEFLEKDIDDSRAHMWDDEATAFSTGYAPPRMFNSFSVTYSSGLNAFRASRGEESFYNRYNNFGKPYYHADKDHPVIWDYIKGSGVPPVIKSTSGSKYAITNYNFETLKGYMKNVRLVDKTPYDSRSKRTWFSRLFEFEIFAEHAVAIMNPLYYWADEVNRFDGYGFWRNMYTYNNQNHVYVGGIYEPYEKCYLMINRFDPIRHWGVVPRTVNLHHYNHSTHDIRWSQSEWKDEGPLNNGIPEKYT